MLFFKKKFKKCENQKLFMKLCYCPDIFQEKMNKMFNGLECVRTNVDDLLKISNESFGNHINKLNKELNRLKQESF